MPEEQQYERHSAVARDDDLGFIFDAPRNIYLYEHTPPPAASPYEVLAAARRTGFRHVALAVESVTPSVRDDLAGYARSIGVKITHDVLCAKDGTLPAPSGLRKIVAPSDAVRLTVREEQIGAPSVTEFAKRFPLEIPNASLHFRLVTGARRGVDFFRELRELGVAECELVFPYEEGVSPEEDLKNVLDVLKQWEGGDVQIRQRTPVPPPHFDARLPVIHHPELRFSNSDGARHDIAVVVPLYNKRHVVEAVAEALLDQTLEPSRFELVFVDDGSSDGTSDHLAEHLRRQGVKHNIKVLHLPRQFQCEPGSSYFTAGWARNAGIYHSTADVILFLDGDMLAAPALIERHLRAHESRTGAVVMGNRIHLRRGSRAHAIRALVARGEFPELDPALVEPKEYGSVCRRLDEGATWGEIDEYPWSTCASCNVSMPLSLLRESGFFDPYATTWGLDDTELFYRLYRAGAHFAYEREAKGYHFWHPPAGGVGTGGEDEMLLRIVPVYFRKYLDLEILRANAYLFSDEFNQAL